MVGLNGLEPSTSRLSGVRSNQLSYRPFDGAGEENRTPDNSLEGCGFTTKLHPHKWWVWTESNRRHLELQSNALPTELQTHNINFKNGGPDGTRTRDLLRDRQAF